jgi:hypothetical protein
MLHFKFRSLSRTPSPPPAPTVLLTARTGVSTTASTELTSLCHTVCTECNRWTLTGFLKDLDEDLGRQSSLDYSRTDLSKIINAVPLKSLLSSHEQSARRQTTYISLSTKQRHGIAAATAWSVLLLSGSPWLSDHWDEKQANIFLERTQGGREVFSRYSSHRALYQQVIYGDPLDQRERDASRATR